MIRFTIPMLLALALPSCVDGEALECALEGVLRGALDSTPGQLPIYPSQGRYGLVLDCGTDCTVRPGELYDVATFDTETLLILGDPPFDDIQSLDPRVATLLWSPNTVEDGYGTDPNQCGRMTLVAHGEGMAAFAFMRGDERVSVVEVSIAPSPSDGE